MEVYYEQGSTGHYVKQSTLAYYAAKDSNVTVGNSSSDTVNFEDFKNYISDFSQYEYDSGNANNVTSGTVASDGSTTLKVYFKGKQTSTTVNYYYRSGTESILMGSVVITGNVGMISPKTVTLKAGGTFTKTYDGSKSITGTELTSLEKGSYYTFSGLAAADAAKGYIISCSAEYNDKDVKDANSITLANIKVTDAEGNVNNNYIFSSGYTLKIPGTVTPKELAIKWGSNAFEYNGTAQIPTVSLAEGSEPVTGENVTVKAQGAQTNAGTYIANASFAADDSYDVNNYRISGDSTWRAELMKRPTTAKQ